MEHVLKVLFQFCKDYCGKNMPSKKDIQAVLSHLGHEGEIKSPQSILDHRRWDDLTSTLVQRVMSNQKGGLELKTWGLILGVLKAAREEGKVWEEARRLWDFAQGDPGGHLNKIQTGVSGGCQPGGSLSYREQGEDRSTKMAPSDLTPPNRPPEPPHQHQDGGSQPSTPLPSEDVLESPPPYPQRTAVSFITKLHFTTRGGEGGGEKWRWSPDSPT